MSNRIIRLTGSAKEILQQIADSVKAREVIEKMRLKENVLLLFADHELDTVDMVFGHNIVTDEGDLYYAQLGAGETPGVDFAGGTAGCRLGTGAGVPDKSSTDCSTFFGTAKAIAATYPKTNDGDSSNTGALPDAVSYKYDWPTGDNNGSAMTNGAIVDIKTAPTKALCHFTFPSYTKTSSQTLAVYVNHRMNGV